MKNKIYCMQKVIGIYVLFAFIFTIFLLIFNGSLLALEKEIQQNTSTDEEQAILCLNESKTLMDKMINDNFSVTRINDSLKKIYPLYDAQRILKEKGGKYDFSIIIPYCLDIENVSRNAYESRDEYNALIKFYKESVTQQMNTSNIDSIIKEIEKEIRNERYEKARPLIDNAYEEIVNVKTSSTALSLFYSSTTRNLKDFFIDNWLIIVISLIVLVILFIVYKRTIAKWWIKKKISNLEVRKNTIKELIMKTQKDYFEKGSISDGSYSIRTKKFSELIRDIERQIPLLREELARVDTKNLYEKSEKKEKIKERAQNNKLKDKKKK